MVFVLRMTAEIDTVSKLLLELDLLQAFLAVIDCGGFTSAAERMHSTQSTVSQKVRRLEERVGHKLLERNSRSLVITEAGQIVLAYARQMMSVHDQLFEALSGALVSVIVRLGVPEDFAGGKTTRALAKFSAQYPQVKLEVTSGLSSDLVSAYDQGDLDLILIKQRQYSRDAVARLPEKTAWVDSAKHPAFDQDPIPLVTFPRRGVYREEIISAVESLGRRWRISFTSSSLSGIQGAVADGMGISLLPRRAVSAEHIELGIEQGLPVIDAFELALCHRPNADPLVIALCQMLVQMLSLETAPDR